MALAEEIEPPVDLPEPMSRVERQIRDYFHLTTTLIWQRQAIFFASTFVTLFYYEPSKTLACYGTILLSELMDLLLVRRIKYVDRITARQARNYMRWIVANTIVSASTISLFVFLIALQQDVGNHFTPMFYLFAAALFAAMNNHQILAALIVRLSIYGVTFFAIGLMDILVVRPDLSSELWLSFFTVIFVTFFIIDCSFRFLAIYRRNMSQLKALQEEHERTKVAYRAKSQFVAIVSHELRTPLTSIKGSLDLLNSGMLGPVPEKMESILGIAGKNSERLALLINDILDLQKIEAGEVNYRFAPVDMPEFVRDAVEANKSFADTMDIKLVADIDAAPDVLARGDERRLMQVMNNMISNAIKFSHKGGTVRVTFTLENERIRVSVIDQGIGIPEESRELVFGKFTQVDSSDQREVGGTGLGMNISLKIVEAHNGVIDYVSEYGRGTTFFMTLDQWEEVKAA
ncbi:MAG: sensor histidine kinase [Arenibacterium sp.]